MRPSRLAIPLAVLAMAVLLPSVASAHARLKSSTPAVGEVIRASPAAVQITFTEEIQKVSGNYSIAVANAAGAGVTAAPAVVDDTDRTKMSVQLQPSLPAGRYVVNWHNVSDEDGDPLDGAFSFYVQTQPTAADLEDDQRLAAIGEEDETPAGGTAEASPAATTAPVTTIPQATMTATASASSDDDDSNTTVYVIIAVLAVAAVGAAGAWWFFARRAS